MELFIFLGQTRMKILRPAVAAYQYFYAFTLIFFGLYFHQINLMLSLHL